MLAIALIWVGDATGRDVLFDVGIAVFAVSAIGWPWSARAYRSRVGRIDSRVRRELREAQAEFRKAHSDRQREVQTLPVPASFEDVHRRLLEAVDQTETSAGSLAARTRTSIDRRRAVESEVAALRTRAARVDEHAYVDEVRQYRSAVDDAYALMRGETERALTAAIYRLEKLRPPRKLVVQHTELCSAQREHLTAWERYGAATQVGDVDAAMKAIRDLQAAGETMQCCRRAIDRHPSRWPGSPEGGEPNHFRSEARLAGDCVKAARPNEIGKATKARP